jgi:Uncharacterized protein conserved in bacteria (DUF2252)
MHRFIDGEDRLQQALLPHSLEDYVDEENPVRVIEIFVDELDLAVSGIQVQACGDCHLLNFGGFATPERRLILDINDFEETLPGPCRAAFPDIWAASRG